ncbi:hypothetical protein MTR67_002034 [Solanum verrucosum]|uniref:Reverse transcriptase domain-containing protein n=1 Tax=Solanum verrucosum TaxID=315347 RepID=A0AAF0T8D6_SOLVR|nr:hypothetical protein MTR67_002034 [Solanum verrucosum]
MNPSLVKNILRQWSKEGFKDGGRVHGKGLRKSSRTVEEYTARVKGRVQGRWKSPQLVNPFLNPSLVKNILRQGSKEGFTALVHPIFHVSLVKSVGDPTSIVPLEGLGVKENFSYEEISIEILDRQVKKLRNKKFASVKVLWRNQKGSRTVEEFTVSEPILVKNTLRQGSKKGFKDGGRVHGKVLRKSLRTVEESTVSEPILEHILVNNILRQGSKEGFKDGGRVHVALYGASRGPICHVMPRGTFGRDTINQEEIQ